MKGRWILIGLIVSAALNLFLIGAAAGVIALGAHMAHARPDRTGPALRHAAMSLTPEHRRAFFGKLRDVGREARPAVQRSRQLRREAWVALASSGEAASAKTKLAEARDLDSQTRAGVETAILDFAASLPAPERKAFLTAMAEARRHRGPPLPEAPATPPGPPAPPAAP